MTIPCMEGQKDRQHMSSNAGVACQKFNHPKQKFPEGKGQSHSKLCRRQLSFDTAVQCVDSSQFG